MITPIVVTVIGEDHPGIVNSLSDVLRRHEGNWSESSMSSLAGHFAGIVLATVPSAQADACIRDLERLEAQGLRVVAQPSGTAPSAEAVRTHSLDLVGHDRVGIVQEITQVLMHHGVNIIELETEVASASMAGGPLFRARALLHVPERVAMQDLVSDLEALANELMVEFRAER